jgi:TnsA endonuclease N terminal.
MAKTAKDVFTPKNPQKYIGRNLNNIIFRSSWELAAMRLFDRHPNVLGWSSECVDIPYINPLTNRSTIYKPDFLVIYIDKTGKQHIEVIEIKPLKEIPGYQEISERTGKPKRLSEQTRLTQVINAAKWKAAVAFCAKRGWKFRVATEKTLFNMGK